MLHANFKIIGLPVLEKKIFKSCYHILAWRSSWSCDLNHLYKLWFPLPKEAPHKIWLWLAKRFQRRRDLKMVNDDNNDDDDDGRRGMDFASHELKIVHTPINPNLTIYKSGM